MHRSTCAHGGQRYQIPLEVELQAIVSHPMWVLGTLDLLGTQTQGLGPVQKASHLPSLGFFSVLQPLSLPAVPSRLHECAGPLFPLSLEQSLFSHPDASSLGHPDVFHLPSNPDALRALSTPQYKAILSNHTLAEWIPC